MLLMLCLQLLLMLCLQLLYLQLQLMLCLQLLLHSHLRRQLLPEQARTARRAPDPGLSAVHAATGRVSSPGPACVFKRKGRLLVARQQRLRSVQPPWRRTHKLRQLQK